MIARPEAPNGSLATAVSLIYASVRHEALVFEWRGETATADPVVAGRCS